MEFRTLLAEEIECRVGTCNKNGFSLLLYKDARVDMNLLDETVGCLNWKREHSVVNGNLFCTVSIWDAEKKEWISKQDVGTESNTEAVKGEASDSFKRACFNVGIGRELYSAPLIWITARQGEVVENNGRYKVDSQAKFYVSEIAYKNREITHLIIKDKKGNVRFPKSKDTFIQSVAVEKEKTLQQALKEIEAAKTVKTLTQIWSAYFNELSANEQTQLTQKLTEKKKEILQ